MTIQLTTDGSTLAAVGSPSIVCDNADYTVSITGATSLTDPVLILDAEQDGENVEYEVTLSGGSGDLPSISNAYGVWMRIEHAGGTTERLWIPCLASIRSGNTTAYSAPYDVYNAAMGYITAVKSGSATSEELEAMLTALRYRFEHPEAFPGTAYKRAITASVRETRIGGKITLTDSSEIDISDDVVCESTLSISTSAVNSDFLLPGGVPSKELAVTLRGALPDELLRGAEITPIFGIRLESGVWKDIPLGIFDLLGAGDDTARGIPIKAYDRMKKLDGIAASDIQFASATGYTPNQIISAICDKAGIEYDQNIDFDERFCGNSVHSCVVAAIGVSDAWSWGIVINDADDIEDIQEALDEMYMGILTYMGDRMYETDLPPDAELWSAYKISYSGPRYIAASVGGNIETARDLLMHTVFTVGGFAEITPEGKMHIVPIVQAHDAETVGENRTHRRTISRLQYKLSSLTMPIDYMQSGMRNTVMHTEETLWPEYNVNATADTNELWAHIVVADKESRLYAVEAQMNDLTDMLDPVVYSPGRIDMQGDPTIGLMDWITTDGTRMMPVTSIVWRYRGQQQLTSCGSDAVAKATESQLSKRIVGDKVEASETTNNIMREIYGLQMQTYYGMEFFTYEEIQHYTYSQLKGGKIT